MATTVTFTEQDIKKALQKKAAEFLNIPENKVTVQDLVAFYVLSKTSSSLSSLSL